MDPGIALWLEEEPTADVVKALAESKVRIAAIGAARPSLRAPIRAEGASEFKDPRTMARDHAGARVVLLGEQRPETIVAFAGTGCTMAANSLPGLEALPLTIWSAVERLPGWARGPEAEWARELVEERGRVEQLHLQAWWPAGGIALNVLLEDAVELALGLIGEPVQVTASAGKALEGADEVRALLRDGRGAVGILMRTADGRLASLSVSNAAAVPLRDMVARGSGWTIRASPGWTVCHDATGAAGAAPRGETESASSALAQQLARMGAGGAGVPALSHAATCHAVALSLATDEPMYVSEAARLLPGDAGIERP